MSPSEKPARGTIADALQEAMAQRSFPTIEAAQDFVEHFFAQHDLRPLDDFHGLSPDQMSQLLYAPFDSPDLVRFQDRVPVAACSDSRFLWLFLQLIDAIGEDGLKPTAKGNLPRKVCQDLAQAYRSRFKQGDRGWHGPVSTETDFFELHVVRVVAGLAGFVRKYKGRFIVSQKYRKLIRKDDGEHLFPALLECYIRQFNWAYWDLFPALPFAQQSFLFTLFLLQHYGKEYRPVSFYADAFLKAFPAVTGLIAESDGYGWTPEEAVAHLYDYRCLRQFAAFTGLAELRFTPNADSEGYHDRLNASLRSTDLLDACWKFENRAP